MEQTLQWVFYGFPIALFVAFGYYGIWRKAIPYRLAIDAVFAWYFFRLIDFFSRIVLTFRDAYPDATATIHELILRRVLVYTTGQIVMNIVYISLIGYVVFALLILLNRKTKDKYIDDADALVLVFGILVAGWPNFLIYLFLVFAFTLVGYLLTALFKGLRGTGRMPISPYFILAGITILIWGDKLSILTGLYVLR